MDALSILPSVGCNAKPAESALETIVSLISPTPVEIGARPILSLSNNELYLIRNGTVDVFWVLGTLENPQSPRMFLCEASGLLPGFGPRIGTSATIFAVVRPDVQVSRVSTQGFADTNDLRIPYATLLDEFFQCLSQGALSNIGREIASDLSDKSATEGGFLAAAAGVQWVRCKTCPDLALFGRVKCNLGSGVFPVTTNLWLSCGQMCDVRMESTLSVIDSLDLAAALHPFRQTFPCLLESLSTKQNAEEAIRLDHYRTLESSSFDHIAKRVQSTFYGRQTESHSPSPRAGGLLGACRVVASAGGASLWESAASLLDSNVIADKISALVSPSDLRPRRVSLRGTWWRYCGGHFVGFRKVDGHPVALLQKGGGYIAVDPESGRSRSINSKTAQDFQSTGFRFYHPFDSDLISPRRLLSFGLRNNTKPMLHAGILATAIATLALVFPIVTQQIFDLVIPTGSFGLLAEYALILIAVQVVSTVFGICQGIFIQRARGQANENLQAALWDRLLRLPISFSREFTAGDLTNRALSINGMFNVITTPLFAAIFAGAFSIISAVMMFVYDWRLAISVVVLTTLLGTASILALSAQVRYQRLALDHQGTLSGYVFQILLAIGKIRVGGAEKRAFVKWGDQYLKQIQQTYRAKHYNNLISIMTSIAPPMMMCVLLLLVASLSNKPDTGDFLAFTVAFQQFLIGVVALIGAANTCATVIPTFRRAQPILRARREDINVRVPVTRLSGAIKIQGISFKYSADGPLIIDRLNLDITAGEFVAICGPSGSGKSTLLRLLLGFERPLSGSINYDSQNLENLELRGLRRQIGAVLQDSKLMPGDIFRNIVGSDNYSIDEAWEAARLAGIDEDIRAMPMQMRTILSEGATTLSGGQRQRILIARALIKRPRIILFDEATSALDNRTQAIVTQSINRLNVTRLVVAHRLSTVVGADRIVVIQGGQIVESGKFQELAHGTGIFSKLAEWQLL